MSRDRSEEDHTLQTLLDYDGETHFVDEKQSYWVKYRVSRVDPTNERPHGVSYSLTLHDPSGKRILGYDNAHSVSGSKRPGAKKARLHDHKHRFGTVRPYEFVDAGRLMADFWNDVEQLLRELGVLK